MEFHPGRGEGRVGGFSRRKAAFNCRKANAVHRSRSPLRIKSARIEKDHGLIKIGLVLRPERVRQPVQEGIQTGRARVETQS